MEKIKSNLPIGLLLSYLVKTLIVSPTLQDAYVVIALIALTAFFKREESSTTVKTYQDQVKALEEKQDKVTKEFRELQFSIQAAKLNTTRVIPGANNGGR